VAAFPEKVKSYTQSFTSQLFEVWDDFIGKMREEGKEEDKAGVMAAPTFPTKPTTDLLNPMASDFKCAGNPCKTTWSTSGSKRSFGVVGGMTVEAANMPLDYPVESVEFYSLMGMDAARV